MRETFGIALLYHVNTFHLGEVNIQSGKFYDISNLG